jgi:copper homeostasis protein
MPKKLIIEVCVDSLDSALVAQEAGADRVELCANLSEGGTTPSFATIEMTQKYLNQTKLYVLIRPRGGDFLYNALEFEMMKSDIHQCGKMGCDGVVIGILNSDGTVDMKRSSELIDIAKSYAMGVTFHRAFDCCVDMFQSLDDVIALGCERILTSGGQNTAIEGLSTLAELIKKANNRISIMPGSGITPENVADLVEKIGATEIHGTFRSPYPSGMTFRKTGLSGLNQESLWLADKQKITTVVSILDQKSKIKNQK